MISDSKSTCPKCGGQLKYYDTVKRIVRTKYGVKNKVDIRRFRCQKCSAMHRELPDFIFPYKQYEAEIIIGVLEGFIETTEEVIENTGMSKGIKIAAGVGLSVIVGFVVYKYVAKPVIANIKTQIELKKMAAEEKTIIVDEADVSTEEN